MSFVCHNEDICKNFISVNRRVLDQRNINVSGRSFSYKGKMTFHFGTRKRIEQLFRHHKIHIFFRLFKTTFIESGLSLMKPFLARSLNNSFPLSKVQIRLCSRLPSSLLFFFCDTIECEHKKRNFP